MKMRWDSSDSSSDSSSDCSSSSSEISELALTGTQIEYAECGADFLKKGKLESWFQHWGSSQFNFASDCFLPAWFSFLMVLAMSCRGTCLSTSVSLVSYIPSPRFWDRDSIDGSPDAVQGMWQR